MRTISFACLVASSAFGLSQNLILNPGFEEGSLSGWNLVNGPVSDSGVTEYFNYSIPATPTYGNWVMRFNGGNRPAAAVLSQTVSTRANTGYTLAFDFGAWGSGSGPNMALQVQAIDSATGGILLNTVVRDTSSVSTLTNLYSRFSFNFNATGTSTRIVFTDVSPMTVAVDGLLDNVSLVPEPTSMIGLAAGLGAVLRLRQAKHRTGKGPR